MKTLKLTLVFCLLACLLLAGCNSGNNSDDLFDGNIIYAPPGLDDDRTNHVHSPGTSAPDTDALTETSDEDTTAESSPSDTDTDAVTDTKPIADTEPIPDTEPAPETDEPSDETSDTEEDQPDPIIPDTPDGVIDMRETLAVGFPVSGQFISKENSRLALAVNYECSMDVDGKVTVTLDVGLLAHAIRCGGRPKEMGNLTIDGVTYNFSTSEIANDSSAQVYIPFVSRTYTVDGSKSSSTVSASWRFNGTYGGERIDALTAAARFIW